ncbi:MAG: replication initiation protein [Clostridia bacterium]
MARRKIKEPITGVSFNPDTKLTIQKSRPLSALWNSSITLQEFKILDTYLSRINSHKPEQRTVRFTKGELEKLLGLKQIKPDVLDNRLQNLMTTVKIPSKTSKRGFTRIALFEQAVADQDENDLWQVDLTCTQSAMKYIFNVENLGYFKYKLKTITSIDSRYSYILFIYLEENRRRKSWEVPLDELKEILNCQDVATYNQFKDFNKLLLKKCQKELTEKTPCNFKYEPIKKGRNVVSIKFTLETIKDMPQIEGQTSFDDVAAENTYSNNFIELLASACNNEFQEDEIMVLNSLMNSLELDTSNENFIGERKFFYLQGKYNELNLRANNPKKDSIHNRIAYLKSMIKE